MNRPARLLNRLISPAAAWIALGGLVVACTLTAPTASSAEDRYALARRVAKGDTPMEQISGPLATKPQPAGCDTIITNTPHWFLPPARPGHETPAAKSPALGIINMRSTILAAEHAIEAYGAQPYPDLPPMTPLAWESFPDPSELSIPATFSGPDGQGAKLSNDPTSRQSRLAVLSGGALLRNAPAEFMRLTIPDPFGVIDAVKLDIQIMPPDTEPPPSPKTPPDPTMPIKPRN
jgi:hypothetical protein